MQFNFQIKIIKMNAEIFKTIIKVNRSKNKRNILVKQIIANELKQKLKELIIKIIFVFYEIQFIILKNYLCS